MSDFKEYAIGTLVKLGVIEKPLDGNHGEIHPKGNDFINSGIPFIMASDIKNSSIDFKNCKFISKNQALTLKKGFAKVGDVLLTHKASIGRSAIIPETDNEYILLTPQVTYYRVKDKQKINNFYLKYYFDSKYFQSAIFSYSGAGSTRAYIGITEQLNLPVKLPSLRTQQKIAAVLSSLDSKIELNNKINTKLEAMAKTLYDYWFVQFDFPNKDGKPYKTSGGKMVWNAELKREIPDGWDVVRLETIINIYDSKRIPLSSKERENMKGVYPYYGATGIFDYINEYIFDGNYILIAEDGSVMGDDGLAIVQYIWGKTWVNNHAHVLQPKESENNEYLFYFLKSISVVQIMTGSIQKKINQENLMNVKLALPDSKKLKLFSEFSEPIRKKIINVIEEIQTLSELRNWLLPMLMNGQVTVKH